MTRSTLSRRRLLRQGALAGSGIALLPFRGSNRSECAGARRCARGGAEAAPRGRWRDRARAPQAPGRLQLPEPWLGGRSHERRRPDAGPPRRHGRGGRRSAIRHADADPQSRARTDTAGRTRAPGWRAGHAYLQRPLSRTGLRRLRRWYDRDRGARRPHNWSQRAAPSPAPSSIARGRDALGAAGSPARKACSPIRWAPTKPASVRPHSRTATSSQWRRASAKRALAPSSAWAR